MKIGIVNDCTLAARAIAYTLRAAGQHEVLWTAANGAEAIKQCARHKPDLVLMDLVMPGLNGAQTIRELMARTPVAILVVTAFLDDQVGLAFEAMGAGALDVIPTPTLNNAAGQKAFLNKISQVHSLVAHKGQAAPAVPVTPPRPAPRPGAEPAPRLVAIGASAGGPAALAEVLGALAAPCDAAVVIVQHVDAAFAPHLATWLNVHSRNPVRLAQTNERPAPGAVYLADARAHLALAPGGHFHYTDQPPGLACQPSVDVFLNSVAQVWRSPALGIILTGMGRDGAQGLLAMRTAGCLTIAQDEATSALYGMPKAARANAAAAEVLPLPHIAARIEKWIQTGA